MVKEAFLNLWFQCGASGLEAVLISFRSPETIHDYLKPFLVKNLPKKRIFSKVLDMQYAHSEKAFPLFFDNRNQWSA